MTTNDEQVTHTCRLLRDHGQSKKYFHDIEGYNGRLDAIQAGFLRVKLRYLAKWNEQRRQAAERYAKLFAGSEGIVTLPHQPSWARSVYHLYVIQVEDRARLQQKLTDVGIGTGFTIRSHCISRRPMSILVIKWATFRSPSSRQRVSCRFRCSQDSTQSNKTGWCLRCCVPSRSKLPRRINPRHIQRRLDCFRLEHSHSSGETIQVGLRSLASYERCDCFTPG